MIEEEKFTMRRYIVCHHPPISAFYLENEKAGVSLNGHCMYWLPKWEGFLCKTFFNKLCVSGGQKSRFKGTSIKVEQVGRAVLYVKKWDEQYIIDFPDLMIRGFLTGAAYLELAGVCTIVSTSGATATIEFIPKPWFGGEHNHIKGNVSYKGEEYFTLSGRWSHKSFFSRKNSSEKELLFDAEAEPMAERVTPPLEEQQDIESHKLWGPVTAALKEKNYQLANAEKTKIEDWQRKLRRERAEKNETWTPKLFTFIEDGDSANTYNERMNELLKLMKRKTLLDNGAWTYNNSLHARQ